MLKVVGGWGGGGEALNTLMVECRSLVEVDLRMNVLMCFCSAYECGAHINAEKQAVTGLARIPCVIQISFWSISLPCPYPRPHHPAPDLPPLQTIYPPGGAMSYAACVGVSVCVALSLVSVRAHHLAMAAQRSGSAGLRMDLPPLLHYLC